MVFEQLINFVAQCTCTRTINSTAVATLQINDVTLRDTELDERLEAFFYIINYIRLQMSFVHFKYSC